MLESGNPPNLCRGPEDTICTWSLTTSACKAKQFCASSPTVAGRDRRALGTNPVRSVFAMNLMVFFLSNGPGDRLTLATTPSRRWTRVLETDMPTSAFASAINCWGWPSGAKTVKMKFGPYGPTIRFGNRLGAFYPSRTMASRWTRRRCAHIKLLSTAHRSLFYGSRRALGAHRPSGHSVSRGTLRGQPRPA